MTAVPKDPIRKSGAAIDPAFGLKVATFYGALFVVYGMHVPYTPVWLSWRGLSAAEISAVMAAPFFLRVFITPAAAVYADRTGSHRRMLIALAWLSFAAVLALSQAPPFWPILVLTIALIIANSTIMPLTETIAVAGVRRAGLDYGRMRLWGSLSFVAASFAGGLAVEHYGGGSGIWLVAAGCLMTAMAAHYLPRDAVERKAPQAGATRRSKFDVRELKVLLSSGAFLTFLVAAGCAQAAHATLLAFGTLIWQDQGLSGGWIGTLWAAGVMAEVALFWGSGALLSRTGPVLLLLVAAAVSCLRWVAMGFAPGLSVLLPLQLLHGITYGASHIAAIHFIHRFVPHDVQGSAQALYSTVAAGIAMGAATLMAGHMYARSGAQSYFAMGGIALISLAAALLLYWRWRDPAVGASPVSDPEPLPEPEPLEAQV